MMRWQLIGYAAKRGLLHPKDVGFEALVAKLCAVQEQIVNCT